MVNPILAICACVCCIYCAILAVVHIRGKHSINARISALSFTASILLVVSVTAIVGSFFFPRVNGTCLCHPWFSTALTAYVAGVYCVKFMYLERVKVFNKEASLRTKNSPLLINLLALSLVITMFICCYLMIFNVNADCHSNSSLHFGCVTEVNPRDIHVAIVMIVIDLFLFCMFCAKWYRMANFLTRNPKYNFKIPKSVWRGFMIQFVCVVVALISCCLDGMLHLIYPRYSTLVFFVFDASLVATCNFCMLKSSKDKLFDVLNKLTRLCCGLDVFKGMGTKHSAHSENASQQEHTGNTSKAATSRNKSKHGSVTTSQADSRKDITGKSVEGRNVVIRNSAIAEGTMQKNNNHKPQLLSLQSASTVNWTATLDVGQSTPIEMSCSPAPYPLYGADEVPPPEPEEYPPPLPLSPASPSEQPEPEPQLSHVVVNVVQEQQQ